MASLDPDLQEALDQQQARLLKLDRASMLDVQKPGLRRLSSARPRLLDEPARAEKRRKVSTAKDIAKAAGDSLFS